MQTDDQDHEVEDLLRQVFDEARREGTRDLSGVRAAALARATVLRRRQRRLATLTSAGGALVAAALVAVVVLPGLGRASDRNPLPATTSTRPTTSPTTTGTATSTATASPTATEAAAQQDWSAFLDNGAPFHYTIPDVEPDPLPDGVKAFGRPAGAPAGKAGGSGAAVPVPTPDIAKGAGILTDADLAGVAGYCRWDEDLTRRLPVAGRAWQYELSSHPGSYAAGLGIAGFATGSGPGALKDLLEGAVPCAAPGLKLSTWPGAEPLDARILTRTATELDVRWTTVWALRRVGDLVVAGSARARSEGDATRIAAQLASRAAARLEQMGFPPALGAPLGKSTEAPNAASEPGAAAGAPLREPAAYGFGDVFPAQGQLPGRMTYHGDPVVETNIAPVMGSQICDSEVVGDKGTGQEEGPKPVAGTYQSAWAGGGGFSDPSAQLTVTGWATGTGAARFQDLQEDRLFCAWWRPQAREAWPGRDASQTWLSHSTEGLTQYTAVQRVGDVLVSAVVASPSAADARRWAIELSDRVAVKVRASGLPAAEGR